MIHHDRHHAAYVNNANQLAQRWPELGTMPIEKILSNLGAAPEAVRTGVRNNVGGHWNHTFFWELMAPGGAKEASGDLKSAIDSAFGGVAAMSDKVECGRRRAFRLRLGVAGGRQGQETRHHQHRQSGHADRTGRACCARRRRMGACLLSEISVPPSRYLKAWWNTVNWSKAAENFKKAMG